MEPINICTAVNSKYVRYLYVMLFSLFKNNEKVIQVYILQADLKDYEKKILINLANEFGNTIIFIEIDIEGFEKNLPRDNHFSLETYFRLMMPELLKDIDRVLYLDVDIIVHGSISDMYSIDIGDKIAAVCQDMFIGYLDEDYQKRFDRYGQIPYFNAGVVLYDLNKVRQRYSFDDFMDVAKKLNYILPYVDQDILNYTFYNQVKWIDKYKYDYMPVVDCGKYLMSKNGSPVIIHFAGASPWDGRAKTEFVKIWWDYAKDTPFYVELLEEQMYRLENSVRNLDKELRKTIYYKDVIELMLDDTLDDAIWSPFNMLIIAAHRKVVLYGAGKMADRVWRIFNTAGLSKEIIGVIDKNKKGTFHGISIVENIKDLDINKEILCIVTPINKTKEITNELKKSVTNNICVIDVYDFFYKCKNGY